MRIEATIPDATGEQLNQLTGELGITRSQVVEEALALLVRAVLEARRGRRVAIIEAESQKTVCEIVSPILTQLEWAAHREKLLLDSKSRRDLARVLEHSAEPTPALRKLMSKRKR